MKDTIGKIDEFCRKLIAWGKPPGPGFTIERQVISVRADIVERGIDLQAALAPNEFIGRAVCRAETADKTGKSLTGKTKERTRHFIDFAEPPVRAFH